MKYLHKTAVYILLILIIGIAIAGGKNSRFITEGGVEIIGSMWIPHQDISPAVILLHMLSRDRTDWDDVAEQLVSEGYAVMSIDLRGHGQSINQNGNTINYKDFTEEDYRKMTLDVLPVIDFFRNDKRVDGDRIAIIGASIGANVALQVAAADPDIRTVILLSPGKVYRGVTTGDAILEFGKRPVLIAASEEDEYAASSSKFLKESAQGDSKLLMSKNMGHGTDMLGKESGLEAEIIEWLGLYMQ